MRKMKKILMAFASAFVMLVMSSSMVFAADTIESEAGKTVTASFGFTSAAGMSGTLSLSGDDIFTTAAPSEIKTSLGVTVDYNEANGKFVFSMANAKDGSIDVTYTIKSDAAAGQSCDINLTGLKKPAADFSGDVSVEDMTVTVVIKAAQGGGDDNQGGDNNQGGNDNQGSTGTDTPAAQPTPSTPSTSTPAKPPVVTVKIDYTELLKQIKIAEGLSSKGYTKESWKALTDALADAIAAKKSTSQKEVDAAADALAEAIAGLEKVDYSRLQAAINDANKLTDSDELAKLWKLLFSSVSNGELLLGSDDQAAVDAAADEILALIEQIKEYLAAVSAGESEEEVKEVIKEVEPEGDYCNIPMHKVWPILFFISLAVNALLIGYVVVSKKKGKDNTPLVDYDVSDDDQ